MRMIIAAVVLIACVFVISRTISSDIASHISLPALQSKTH